METASASNQRNSGSVWCQLVVGAENAVRPSFAAPFVSDVAFCPADRRFCMRVFWPSRASTHVRLPPWTRPSQQRLVGLRYGPVRLSATSTDLKSTQRLKPGALLESVAVRGVSANRPRGGATEKGDTAASVPDTSAWVHRPPTAPTQLCGGGHKRASASCIVRRRLCVGFPA
jgi:hypothetical protein